MMFGYYLAIFLAFLAFEYAYCIIAERVRIVDRPHHQSSHRGVVVRGGGIVFFIAYFCWSLSNGFAWYGSLIGLTLLAIVSFVDDIHSLSPSIRLICQFLAVVMLFYHTGLIQAHWHVIMILVIVCVGAINIYNFMDGINGMTGGYSLIVASALLYVNQNIVPFSDESLLYFVIIAILVFSLFNFRKQALCFAGDVGSLSIGYILVYLVLRLALKGLSMAWIAMLAVYLVEGGMTILHRLLFRENLMKPHKKHAYQIMANELKMPHLVVSGIYMGLQAVCCVWYIACPGYLTLFLEAGILVTMYMMFMKKYYHLHVRKKNES